MKQRSKKIILSSVIIALLINLIFVILGYLFNVPFNETNDDTGMAAILSNAYGSGRTHMVFSNVIYAYLLSGLYQLLPGINWYSVMQFLITFTSFWIVGYLLLEYCGKKVGSILYVVLLRFFFSDFYLIYQFTRVSMLCCIAGGLWMIFSLQKNKKVSLVFAFLWTLIGTLIRYKSFIAVAPIILSYAIVFVLLKRWKQSNSVKDYFLGLKKYILTLALFMISMLGCIMLDNWYYNQDAEWAEYKTYNRLRADILDYGWPSFLPTYEEHESEYQEIGISKNDLEFYSIGIFSDIENIPMSKLEKLLELKEKYTYHNYDIRQMIVSYREYLSDNIFLILLTILSILYAITSKGVIGCIYSILNYASVVVMYYYLFSLNRIVDRAFTPVILAGTIALLCAYQREQNIIYEPSKKQMIIFMILFLFGSYQMKSPAYEKRVRECNEWQVDGLYQMLEQNTTDIYIADRLVFDRNYNFFNAFNHVPENFYERQLNIGGWLARTPILQKSQKDMSVKNMYSELIDKDNMYFYTENKEYLLENYLKEHYSEDISLSVAKYVEDRPIIKFIRYNSNSIITNVISSENKDYSIIDFSDSDIFEDYYKLIFKLSTSEDIIEENLYLKIISEDGGERVFSICESGDGDKEYDVYIAKNYIDMENIDSYDFQVYYKKNNMFEQLREVKDGE